MAKDARSRADNGYGQITERPTKNGSVFDLRIRRAGQGTYFKGGFDSREKALAHADVIRRSRNIDALLRQRNMRLPELVQQWHDSTKHKKTGATIVVMESALANHFPRLNVPVEQVSARLLEEFFADLPNHISKSGTNGHGIARHVLNMTRASLKWAARPDVRLIDENPMRDVPVELGMKAGRRQPVEPAAFRNLMAATAGKQSQLIWYTLAATGARKGEVTPLLWSDVNFATLEINIDKISTPESKGSIVENRVKMGQARLVPLDEDLADALLALKQRRQAKQSDPVFPAPRKGGTIGFGTINKWWYRDCLAAGLKTGRAGFQIHGLRHMFTTATIDAGEDVNVVSEILGHSSTATTMAVYRHVSEGKKKKTVSFMGALLKPTG